MTCSHEGRESDANTNSGMLASVPRTRKVINADESSEKKAKVDSTWKAKALADAKEILTDETARNEETRG